MITLNDEVRERTITVTDELVTIQDATDGTDAVVIERDYDQDSKSATFVK